jgi:hypothetical protein
MAAVLVVWGGRGIAAPVPNDHETAAARQILDQYLERGGGTPSDISTSLTFKIDASLPRMHKHGIMRGLKLVTGTGRVVYTQLNFVGDDLIKTAVIGRFLSAEAKPPAAGEDLAISARNYRFHYKGRSDYNDRPVLVFALRPQRWRVGLFEGEIWLDSKTARPLREWGRFTKSPSMFVSNINFVRDYVIAGEESRPRRIILKLRAAFAGAAELTMWLGEPENTSN